MEKKKEAFCKYLGSSPVLIIFTFLFFTETPIKAEDYSDDVQVGKSILGAYLFFLKNEAVATWKLVIKLLCDGISLLSKVLLGLEAVIFLLHLMNASGSCWVI